MRFLKWLPIVGFIFLFLAGGCTVGPTTTSSSPTPTPAISEEKAIAIAATQLPLKLVEPGAVYTQGNSTTVVFEGINATEEDLGWQADGKTVFQPDYANSGPPGTYATLMVTVNPSTGEIDKRSALKLPNGGYISVPEPPRSGFGCTRPTPSPTPTPAISENKAIAIAAMQLPLQVVERATVQIDDVGGWRVKFLGADTTKQELNWPEDAQNQFGAGVPGNVPGRGVCQHRHLRQPIDWRYCNQSGYQRGLFLAPPPPSW